MAALASASAELSPLTAYLANFTAEDADLPFLFFYQIDPSPTTLTTFTRGEVSKEAGILEARMKREGGRTAVNIAHYGEA